jgi:hypothetical protein
VAKYVEHLRVAEKAGVRKYLIIGVLFGFFQLTLWLVYALGERG